MTTLSGGPGGLCDFGSFAAGINGVCVKPMPPLISPVLPRSGGPVILTCPPSVVKVFCPLYSGCVTADYEPVVRDDTAEAQPAQRSFMGELAHVFTTAARIFSDPEVRKAGDHFFAVLDKAGARELRAPRLLMLDGPRREPDDNGSD